MHVHIYKAGEHMQAVGVEHFAVGIYIFGKSGNFAVLNEDVAPLYTVTKYDGTVLYNIFHKFFSLYSLRRESTAILTERPLVTCSQITLFLPSIRDGVSSMPLFTGPGCMIIASLSARASILSFTP